MKADRDNLQDEGKAHGFESSPFLERVNALLEHPRFEAAVQAQARQLLAVQEIDPRIASQFATQQRWLMGHAGIARYFRALTDDGTNGITHWAFLDAVQQHGLASRNTATAFFEEALKYGIIQLVGGEAPAHPRVVEPSKEAVSLLMHWHLLHLATLDALDGGSRRKLFAADGGASLARVQPLVADGLLRSSAIRNPGPLFSLFTWMDEGGLVMDRLIAGMADLSPVERMPTDITSVTMLSSNLAASRTHTGRKLAAAEALGGLGWTGRRGHSPLWLSLGFRREYALAQAGKLAVIDAALAEAGLPVEA